MAPDPDPRNLFMAAAGAVLGVVLAPIVAPVFLGIVGFGAAGPIAGTAAAAIQAGIGNVAAGSLFATAQSVAMGGSIPTVITAIGAGVGAAIGAGAGDTDDPPDNDDKEDSADNADDVPPSNGERKSHGHECSPLARA